MEVRETGKISQTHASEEKVKETEQDSHWLVFSDSVLNFNWSSLPEPNTPSSFESISANQEDADAPSLPAVSVDKVDGNMKRAKIMSGATVTACTEAPP